MVFEIGTNHLILVKNCVDYHHGNDDVNHYSSGMIAIVTEKKRQRYKIFVKEITIPYHKVRNPLLGGDFLFKDV